MDSLERKRFMCVPISTSPVAEQFVNLSFYPVVRSILMNALSMFCGLSLRACAKTYTSPSHHVILLSGASNSSFVSSTSFSGFGGSAGAKTLKYCLFFINSVDVLPAFFTNTMRSHVSRKVFASV